MKEEQTITVYITKYALTKGVIKHEVTQLDWDKNPNFIYTKPRDFYLAAIFYKERDVWDTIEAAEADFRFQLDKKKSSLNKQLKKLESLKMKIV